MKTTLPALHEDAVRAESCLASDPRSACFYSRRVVHTGHAPTGPDYFFAKPDIGIILESIQEIARTAQPLEVA